MLGHTHSHPGLHEVCGLQVRLDIPARDLSVSAFKIHRDIVGWGVGLVPPLLRTTPMMRHTVSEVGLVLLPTCSL